ncbi:adenylyltransferase and sulfurtransferase MOCS3 isoform X2 [Cylas formicarius]|uniref:adenylyltransferase and sulfurtransferase MOCS3 isoform X2 n=1 Tax=Cylas formicarius TaxID=197179 RepID=UPI0029586E1D|nr:adenylyltransferase and sulfurtransferase MOCS3 isoform X2 [Cylas formicarius]
MFKNEIKRLNEEIKDLREKLFEKECLLRELQSQGNVEENVYCNKLKSEEIARYSRQTIMNEVGVSGQLAIKDSKVLIVGMGGLGCPAALYLVSAGVGEITIVDYDEVELSNLHRQILHSEYDLMIPKVQSAYEKLARINSNTKIIPLQLHITSHSINDLILHNKYSVVIDGSDNVATRYLLNDACILNDIPLVSGSALQMEGQLTVYNYKTGPCYRCIFPVPPPPRAVKSCGDGGVLGPVPGVIGILQALEALKIIVNSSGVLYGRLLLFDGSSGTFRNIKLRPRNVKCEICGDTPSIKKLIDYEEFCGAAAHDKVTNIDILSEEQNINVKDFSKLVGPSFILDVRANLEYEMCKIPRTLNIPLSELENTMGIIKFRNLWEQRLCNTDKNEEEMTLKGQSAF